MLCSFRKYFLISGCVPDNRVNTSTRLPVSLILEEGTGTYTKIAFLPRDFNHLTYYIDSQPNHSA